MSSFALIGSRVTPTNECEALEEIAIEMMCLGYHGRSGGAIGPDTALTRAIIHMSKDTQYPPSEFGTIWLPSYSFNGLRHGDLGGACKDANREPTFRGQAAYLAMGLHSGWHNLPTFVRKLHSRNVFQILGPNLNEPVDYVICAAVTTRSGYVKGGTATAVRLAKMYGIPVINISVPGGIEAVETLLHNLKESL